MTIYEEYTLHSFHAIAAKNIMMAKRLIKCMAFILKLVGRLGSFLRKKYSIILWLQNFKSRDIFVYFALK